MINSEDQISDLSETSQRRIEGELRRLTASEPLRRRAAWQAPMAVAAVVAVFAAAPFAVHAAMTTHHGSAATVGAGAVVANQPTALVGLSDAEARKALQACLDDDNAAIDAGGLGQRSGPDWTVLASASSIPGSPVTVLGHKVNGKIVLYPTPQLNGEYTDPMVAVIGRETGTGRMAICTAIHVGNGKYGPGSSAVDLRVDVPGAGQAARLGNSLSAGDYSVNFGLYGAGVAGVKVGAGDRLVYMGNGAFIDVNHTNDNEPTITAVDAKGSVLSSTSSSLHLNNK